VQATATTCPAIAPGRKLPLGQSESYNYDSGGNLQSEDRLQPTLNDVRLRQLEPAAVKDAVNCVQCAAGDVHVYPNGQRKTMGDRSGTTTYTYDNRNRLQSKQTPFGTLSYTYDAAGNVLTINSSNAGGISDTYTYDALNRLSTVTDASGQTTYGYDDVGNLQGYTYPNGVASSYNYDQLNRLKQVSSQVQGAQLASYTYRLGAAGNRLAVAELSGRNVVYGYDSLYRLTSETVASDPHSKNGAISYTYDNVGNRLTLNTTLPPAGGMTYSYDVDDRLGSEQDDAEGNAFAAHGISFYDFENHLQNQAGAVSIFYDTMTRLLLCTDISTQGQTLSTTPIQAAITLGTSAACPIPSIR
jgi:YD repeat-containing protein